jgi:putative endonuclease
VYLLLCEGNKLYAGIARDPDARLAMHRARRGAFYTRLNRPVRILAREWHPSRSAALKAEYALKQCRTEEKWAWTRRQ